MAIPSFIFGGNTGETQDTLARKRKVAEALMVKGSIAPKNVGEGLSAIGNALLYRSLMKKIDGGEKETADNAAMDYNALFGGASPAVTPGKTGGNMPKVDSAGNIAPVDIAGGDVFTPFMDTVKTGVQNPYALAAIAATGNAESKFSPGNVNRTWSDPSESGQPGTAGGIMSWRGPRYQALAATGDLTPTGQAKFFLQENPQLIEALNKAGSVEEAQSLMNKAWAFAGHDRPGGEAQRRLDAANAYLPQFAGQKPTEVASLDPSAGMPDTAANAIEAQAPGGMGSPLTEQSFNDRFGQANIPAEVAQGREGLATALTDSRAIQPAQLPVDGASLADEAAAFRQTPEYAAQFPGQGATPDPRVAAALANPQAASQAALPVIPQADTAQQPQVNPQVAQALMAGDQSGVGIGGAEPQGGYFPAQPNAAAQSGPSMQQLMQAAANPNLNDGQRAVVNALLQRKMEADQRASDPAVALDTELKRAQIAALGRKGEGYSVLSKAERQQLGIPDTDQRVYQRGADGKIDAVGGAGQTINVGNEVEARRQAAAQAGLSESDPAYQGFILTGKLPRENEQTLTATDKKAILEADEMVQGAENVLPLLNRAIELNDEAYSGPTAGIRGTIMGAVGDDAGQATQELDNVVTGQALGQMKAIFGGNPTEGERAILLDIAGSSKLPAEVRKGIFDRAMAAVNRRLDFYKQRATDMRGGTYFKAPGEADPTTKKPAGDAQPAPQKRRKFNPATGELE